MWHTKTDWNAKWVDKIIFNQCRRMSFYIIRRGSIATIFKPPSSIASDGNIAIYLHMVKSKSVSRYYQEAGGLEYIDTINMAYLLIISEYAPDSCTTDILTKCKTKKGSRLRRKDDIALVATENLRDKNRQEVVKHPSGIHWVYDCCYCCVYLPRIRRWGPNRDAEFTVYNLI